LASNAARAGHAGSTQIGDYRQAAKAMAMSAAYLGGATLEAELPSAGGGRLREAAAPLLEAEVAVIVGAVRGGRG